MFVAVTEHCINVPSKKATSARFNRRMISCTPKDYISFAAYVKDSCSRHTLRRTEEANERLNTRVATAYVVRRKTRGERE